MQVSYPLGKPLSHSSGILDCHIFHENHALQWVIFPCLGLWSQTYFVQDRPSRLWKQKF